MSAILDGQRRRRRAPRIYEVQRQSEERERAVLVGSSARGLERRSASRAAGAALGRSALTRLAVDESLEELSLLAQSAGASVVDRVVQTRGAVDSSYFVSKGKLGEVEEAVQRHGAQLVIFDEDLSAGQARNLAERLKVKVLDRTELILDIFARRARTREARLAVELAQLEYLLPRLTGLWLHLSRTGGGIGTRGPGETQLEVDRRRVRARIATVKRGLAAVDRERDVQRAGRRDIFRVALVGYTNAGKSTLFNALTRSSVTTDPRLFATLDPTTRRLKPPIGETVLVSDTVGFIRKLPHRLVASFRATLAEVREADLLLHVVDASHPSAAEHVDAVQEVLDEIGALTIPSVLVLNKLDRVTDEAAVMALEAAYPGSVAISAANGTGVDAVWRALAAAEDAHRRGERALA